MADMSHFLQPFNQKIGDICDFDTDNYDFELEKIVLDVDASGDSPQASVTTSTTTSTTTSASSSTLSPPSPSLTLTSLPTEILLHITSSLDYKTVCRLGTVCKNLHAISLDQSLWKRLCEIDYMVEECCVEVGWRTLYMSYHSKFGRYHSTKIYRTIRRLWTRLENYLTVNDPELFSKLREPCSHCEIKIAEEAMRHRFPADLRCSLQIHNGQINDTGVGIHGTIALGTYYRSEGLLDAACMAREYKHEGKLKGCVPLTHCRTSRSSQFIAVDDSAGFEMGSIFYPVQQNPQSGVFYSASSYTEWLTDLVESLETRFPRLEDEAFRLVTEPGCLQQSHDCFTVTAATCFMPDLSTIEPPYFLHVYRVTISMDASAPKHMSCQLLTRHWIITDDTGHEEYVDGPGVVGEHPVMTPGASFSWISCCNFSTTYGNMRGRFCMKKLETDEEIYIDCPVYHMKCLPHELTSDHLTRAHQKKKNL